MSLVGKVGRKRARARLAMAFLYLVLCVGALTTIYPFLFMATTGFKGPTDQNDNRLVPAFWTDDEELVKKCVDDKYAGDLNMIASYTQGEAVSSVELKEYQAFLESLPINKWRAGFRVPPNGVTSRLAVRWQAFLRQKYGTIDALNKAYVDLNNAFQQVPVPFEAWERKAWVQPDSQKFKDWLEFKVTLPAEFRIPIRTEWMWQEFLRTKFKNRFGDVPHNVRGESATSFAELKYFSPTYTRYHGTGLMPRMDEYAKEFEYQLPKQFQRTAGMGDRSLEASFGWRGLPFAAFDRNWALTHAAELKTEFTGRNYAYSFDYMALHGNALWNTVIFCLLAIVTQLTVNPLAAYALSRFPMRSTARILLFLLATMAFPAEVAMIPSFLLLKNLGLLNTFAALVLPTAASGYTIFLLKGFFDSLPQEVFDSGQVDGAPEWLMMVRLAFPLSKPVLGYIALLAFMGAYGSFIYAFLV
ncbi:MAG: carbohydrate ABC transporter permease, partial [Armatimonadetes bacterium]|nr:carbohydrate ABC transporter permease [Armatimonadota bacterium]